MKMRMDHYDRLKTAIIKALEKKEISITQVIKEYKDNNLSDMRMRWDLFHFSEIGDYWKPGKIEFTSYLNDSHIDTGLRKVVSELTE